MIPATETITPLPPPIARYIDRFVARRRLIRLGEDDHLLLATTHQIIADGWSLGILWHEVNTFYAALMRGETAALPPLPVHYADYAVWQRGWLTGDELASFVKRINQTGRLGAQLD